SLHLGDEQLVLVESATHRGRDDTYLDHDADDATTAVFFQRHHAAAPPKRAFFDDIYGILDGVALGFGRAVISRHLMRAKDPIRLVRGYGAVRSPVYLHRFRQSAYSRAQLAVYEALRAGVPQRLETVAKTRLAVPQRGTRRRTGDL